MAELLAAVERLCLVVLAYFRVKNDGRAAAEADAGAEERDALVRQQAREAELRRLDRSQLLERMHQTDDRVRAIQSRLAPRE